MVERWVRDGWGLVDMALIETLQRGAQDSPVRMMWERVEGKTGVAGRGAHSHWPWITHVVLCSAVA